MKKYCLLTCVLFSLGFSWAGSVFAVSLQFSPADQTVLLGEPVSVDIVISDLDAGGAPSVGAFDLDVSYDSAILGAVDVAFNTFLGNPADISQTQTDFSFEPGVIDLAENSLLSIAELDTMQPASFTLGTLSFDTLALGRSPLDFTQAIIGDAFGEGLSVSSMAGSVNVVPEPGIWAMMLAGGAFIGWQVNRQRRNNC